MELERQKCVSCEGKVEALSHEEANQLILDTPGWEIIDDRIEKTFKFSDFHEAMDFANQIAHIADEENHHPDLYIAWGKARVELSTHKVGGLSKNDFIMAAKINKLVEDEE